MNNFLQALTLWNQSMTPSLPLLQTLLQVIQRNLLHLTSNSYFFQRIIYLAVQGPVRNTTPMTFGGVVLQVVKPVHRTLQQLFHLHKGKTPINME